MGRQDVIWGGVLFALGAVLFALIPGQIKNVGGSAVGPRAFPYFLSVLLMVSSGALALQGGSRRRKKGGDSEVGVGETARSGGEESQKQQNSVVFALGIFALLAVYACVMRWIGYIPASLVFLMVLLYLLGVRKKHLYVLIIPIILGVYVVFRMILNVQLP